MSRPTPQKARRRQLRAQKAKDAVPEGPKPRRRGAMPALAMMLALAAGGEER